MRICTHGSVDVSIHTTTKLFSELRITYDEVTLMTGKVVMHRCTVL